MLALLKSSVMSSATLVAYPVLAVVALFYGLLFGFARTAIGVIRNFGTVLLLPFAPVSVLARSESNSRTEIIGIVGTCVMGFGLVIVNVPNIVALFGHSMTGDKFAMWLQSHNNIVLALTGTYLFSCLYEGGRAYCNYLTGSASSRQAGSASSRQASEKSSQSEVPEAKIVTPQSYGTMFSKISDMDKVSEEEAWTLLGEAVDVGKGGKMKLKDAGELLRMISARAPSQAVVR